MPSLIRAAFAFGVAAFLASCASEPEPLEPYPFVGTWDCGGLIYTFTETTFNNGKQTAPIQSVARDGRNYMLVFPGGYMLSLIAVTETGLTWVSSRTGNQGNCRRLN
jgi:hypothetical protein